MSLKHLMTPGLIAMVCVSCSSASPQLSPQEVPQIADPTVAAEVSEATWGDDMTYGRLRSDDTSTEAVMAVVGAYFDANRRVHEREWQEFMSRFPESTDYTPLPLNQTARIRDKIGNLVFVEIATIPDQDLISIHNARYEYVAVILGDNPRLVNLPDKALFVHFAKNIRSDPDKLEAWDRIKTALLLATGSNRYERDPYPTWTDEGGTLVIRYHTHYPDGASRRESDLFECILTVDAEQDFTHVCHLAKSEVVRIFRKIREHPRPVEYRKFDIRTALRLATDSDNYEADPAPTWSDEDGTLVVRYHRYISKDDQAQPSLHACTLTVDAEQAFVVECVEQGDGGE